MDGILPEDRGKHLARYLKGGEASLRSPSVLTPGALLRRVEVESPDLVQVLLHNLGGPYFLVSEAFWRRGKDATSHKSQTQILHAGATASDWSIFHYGLAALI